MDTARSQEPVGLAFVVVQDVGAATQDVHGVAALVLDRCLLKAALRAQPGYETSYRSVGELGGIIPRM